MKHHCGAGLETVISRVGRNLSEALELLIAVGKFGNTGPNTKMDTQP